MNWEFGGLDCQVRQMNDQFNIMVRQWPLYAGFRNDGVRCSDHLSGTSWSSRRFVRSANPRVCGGAAGVWAAWPTGTSDGWALPAVFVFSG
jgi:hypothetical protein